ncbi:MAG: hypothetical protein HQK89_15305 [Nitrospirae bacterium]|nr:hypothetical protein [Nitrospirota bacterium]
MARTIELYNILKDTIGEEGSRAIVETFEEVAKESKVDYKDDLKAIKDDIKDIRQNMVTKTELKTDLKLLETKLDAKMRLYFLILLFAMFITNPKAIDLFAKLLGLVK